MTTIKGPFNFKGGIPLSEQIQEILSKQAGLPEGKGTVPFTAKNWRSTYNSDLVDGGKPLIKEKEKIKDNIKSKLNKKR